MFLALCLSLTVKLGFLSIHLTFFCFIFVSRLPLAQMLCKQRFLRAFSDLSLFIFPLLRYTRIAEYEGGSAYEITERIREFDSYKIEKHRKAA